MALTREKIDKPKYNLDGEKLYDEETGETICEDIRDATKEQFKIFMEG